MMYLCKRGRVVTFLIGCFCWALIDAAAQEYPEKALSFQALTINDGLSQGMVNWILQDHYGFMWFATKDGLNRYDGYHFTVFRHNARDSTTIADNLVQTMFEDSKGRLWIGTASGGLNLFVNATETFIHITHREGDVHSLSLGAVNQIVEDKQGNIWVRVLDKLEKITVNEKAKRNEEKFLVEHIELPSVIQEPFLFVTQFGKIYYADCEKGTIYTPTDEKKIVWSVAFDSNDFFNKKGAKLLRITNSMVEDKTAQKFYLFYSTGIVCFDEKKAIPEKIFPGDMDPEYEGAIDTSGIIWFSNTGDSLAMLNTKTGELKYAISTDAYVNRCLHTVYTTYIDRSGIVWVGTKRLWHVEIQCKD